MEPPPTGGEDIEMQRRRRAMLVQMLGTETPQGGPSMGASILLGIGRGLLNAAQHFRGGAGGSVTTSIGPAAGYGGGEGG